MTRRRTILEPIEMGRQDIVDEILQAASARTADLGIELLDLRLKRDQLRGRRSSGTSSSG